MMPTYIHKNCLHCNIEFLALPRDRDKKFCTYKCSHEYKVAASNRVKFTNCVNCNTILVNRNAKFCSHSCSAIYSNKHRDITNSYSNQSKTLKDHNSNKLNFCKLCDKSFFGNTKDHFHLKSYIHNRKQLFTCLEVTDDIKDKLQSTGRLRNKRRKREFITKKIRRCANCNKHLTNVLKKYCTECFPNIRHYRSLCKFNFNVFDYPNDFDINLVNTYGWFSPNGYKRRNKTSNLSGVSRDHLYTVVDGFKNHIDPKLLAHPANCRLMIHNGPKGNNSKKSSSITLDELLDRIKSWDETH